MVIFFGEWVYFHQKRNGCRDKSVQSFHHTHPKKSPNQHTENSPFHHNKTTLSYSLIPTQITNFFPPHHSFPTFPTKNITQKCKVIFFQTINFSALKPSATTSCLKSHNLHILKIHICHYTLRGIISTNPLNTIPVQVCQ